MVALLLYGYSRGVRSARALERSCWEDVAFKTIAMMETPDHATIAFPTSAACCWNRIVPVLSDRSLLTALIRSKFCERVK